MTGTVALGQDCAWYRREEGRREVGARVCRRGDVTGFEEDRLTHSKTDSKEACGYSL